MSVDPDDRRNDLPLGGIRVLDFTDGLGEMGARILADLGADVVKVESPTGARSRHREPLVAGRSLYFETHNANKRGITLDLSAPEGPGHLLRLVADADVLFESAAPGVLERCGYPRDDIRRRFPTLVQIAVTDFGSSGPYRDWVATEWIHYALGGVLSRSGVPGKAPLLPPGALATESASITAAWAALLALFNREQTGVGDDVEVSVHESTVQVIDPGFGMAGSAAGGIPTSDGPRGRPDARHLYPIYPCADGHVRLCVLSPRQWDGMFEWMGRPAEFADPELRSLSARHAAAGPLAEFATAMFAEKTRDEIVAEGQRFGVPTGALLSLDEVLAADHFRARATFTDITTDRGTLTIANGFMDIDGRRAGIRHAAPTLGEHNDAVLSDEQPGAGEPAGDGPRRSPSAAISRRPLEGVRVLDLGVIVAGGEAGRLLADMGAEVIKVENRIFPDGSRQTVDGAAISPVFAWGHRNKQSLGLNLRSARGRAYFEQLVEKSDVVLSNFKPGTLEKLGLGYRALAAVNPRIVMADSSAFGSTGPWSKRMGYGPLVRASVGLSGQWRYPLDEGGEFSDATTIYPDHVAARVVAIGVVAKLLQRRRTGRGGQVSVSQAEVILNQHAHLFAARTQLSGAERSIPEHDSGDAPRGVYACRGDDEWLVIDVRNSEDWRNLAAAIERADLAESPHLRSPQQRRAAREELDKVIEAWACGRSATAAMHTLQARGIPAARMTRLPDLLVDPHLVARGHFRQARHPLIDRVLPSENTPARFSRIPDVELRPAPLLGQDTREIAARLLGLRTEEIEALIEEGVLEVADPRHSELSAPRSA
ncbi:CoA transferase [Nocardia sp. R7R-8]|uniref:CoA transferase n=1 Tax=Nocardia sp. R7R-8 TaxID=3459304 RepID=UPI00403D896F